MADIEIDGSTIDTRYYWNPLPPDIKIIPSDIEINWNIKPTSKRNIEDILISIESLLKEILRELQLK